MRQGAVDSDFHAARHDNVRLADGDDARGGQHRLQPRRTLLIDADGRHLIGKPRGEGHHAGRIVAGGDVADDHPVDLCRLQPRLLQRFEDHRSRQVLDAALPVQPADAAERRPFAGDEIGGSQVHARRGSWNGVGRAVRDGVQSQTPRELGEIWLRRWPVADKIPSAGGRIAISPDAWPVGDDHGTRPAEFPRGTVPVVIVLHA